MTANLTLVADLNCSLGGSDGLEVDEDGITIDLNGHSIIGAGGADGYVGIDLNWNSNVTIKKGTIRNFQTGIYDGGVGAYRPTISKVNIVIDGDFSNATDLYGIYLDNSYQAALTGVNVTSPAQQDAKSTASSNTNEGVYLHAAFFSTVTGNTDNGGDGFQLGNFAGAVVTGNTSNNNGDSGFNMFSNDTCYGLFAKNKAFGNGDWAGYASNSFIPETGNKSESPGNWNNVNVAKFCV